MGHPAPRRRPVRAAAGQPLGRRAGHRARLPAEPAPLSNAQRQAGLRDARDHGFLWRIRKNGVTSHLYGTLHVARRAWMFPGPQVRAALEAAGTLALELDPLDASVQRALAEGMAAHAATLELPAALRARLALRLRAECLSATSLDGFGPEMRVALLSVAAGRRDGLEPTYGIDLYLAGFARSAAKRVVSLETPQEQLQALHMPTPAEALAMVENGLAELEAGRARPMLMRMAQVWADADHDTLMRYDDWCECRTTAADIVSMKRLLDDRNPALAERIDALHAGGAPVFAAVGSLHMIGPLGLPALLAQRGFTVERVEYPR